ncbi:hypothetical protein ACFTY7_31260 [Streptomyces sp. NPDC057062]
MEASRLHPRRDARRLEATDSLDSGEELPLGEGDPPPELIRGFEQGA